ncbi:hypothetical protein RvY_04648 [Ramazzottius varieornatus]|uniref:Amino acid permease/ SLC12A domain-containing protein n=1 Tax=Ramazzottius varieornatus TaxID=947166 RepID=A0A1D1USC3_RAMVA|nr:hypothetical protein RvY_04648 [Ramazzottius varieornatus]
MDIFEEERVPIRNWKEDGREPDAVKPYYENSMKREDTVKPRPKIGLISGISIIAGSVIGSGIFICPAGVLRNTGSVGVSLVIWVLSGLFSFLGAYCYAELGTTIVRSGGDYAYIYEAFGPLFAFFRLWVECLIVRPVCQAIVALTFAEYILMPFYPGCSRVPHAPTIILAVVCVFLLTFINCWDAKWAIRTQNFFTAAKLIGLAIIIITGFVQLGRGRTRNFDSAFDGTTKDLGNISIAFYLALFAYNGWNSLNFVAEELHDPERNIPKAIIVSSIVVVVIYFLVNVAFFAVIPSVILVETPAVGVLFGTSVYGSMAWIMPLAVALSTFGAYNGILFTTSRLYLAGARQSQMPEVFGMVQIDRVTPVPAALLTSLVSLLYLALGRNVYSLINLVSIVNWLSIGTSVFVLIFLRWKRPNLRRPFKISLLWPVLYLLSTVFLSILPLYRKPLETGVGILLILTALPVYFLMSLYRKEKPPALENLTGTRNTVSKIKQNNK